MKSITLTITESVYNDLKKIFANEPDFKPMTHEDYVIVNVLKSVIDSYETIDVSTVTQDQ
jgi:hypothetical protein